MDADGLPLIGPGIDFTKVEAIHQKRTLAFLNHFVTHTARFMNRFSCVCEEKLADLCTRMQRLETSMSVLEAKLSSIPGLENVTVSTTAAAAETQPATSAVISEESPKPTDTSQHVPEKQEPEPETEPEKPTVTVSQDPRYAKFFKMMGMGVPVVAVKQKMTMEGLNPDFLDNPNAAAPASNSKDDSDADFSDDNDRSDESSDDFTDDD